MTRLAYIWTACYVAAVTAVTWAAAGCLDRAVG